MNTEKADFCLGDIRPDEFTRLQAAAYARDLERLHTRLAKFQTVSCPACGTSKSKSRFTKYRCQFVECNDCATLYMSPRPTPEIMSEYYLNSENYAVWNKYIFPASENHRREKICRPNLERILEVCRKLGMEAPNFLEVGPGFGTFASLAKESGFFSSVSVVERTPEMASSCRSKGLSVIESALEDVVALEEGIADVAVCFEVIEHVFDPPEFVRAINRILKPGGLFAFTCPNGAGFDTKVLQAASPAVDTEHVNLFNTKSIAALLSRCGFQTFLVETPGRLDVDIVRRAAKDGTADLSSSPFLHEIVVERFEELGAPFQSFLAQNCLSGSMRVFATKIAA